MLRETKIRCRIGLRLRPGLPFPIPCLTTACSRLRSERPIRPLEFADAIGGLERAYAFGPDLPPGLSFDMGTPEDGTSTIKGTPTEPWSPVWYTYRVADASSSQVDSLHFGIEVVEAFSLARPTDRYYTVGVPVSDVVAGARGGTSHSYAVDKGLPPGLALDAPAGRIHGTPHRNIPENEVRVECDRCVTRYEKAGSVPCRGPSSGASGRTKVHVHT